MVLLLVFMQLTRDLFAIAKFLFLPAHHVFGDLLGPILTDGWAMQSTEC